MFLYVCKQTFFTFRVRISQKVNSAMQNAKPSSYYFYVKTRILIDFHICIRVPLRNLNGQQTSEIRKNITGVFQDIGFSLEIESNLKEADFLDYGTYRPYKKPNDSLLYINSLSNQPPNVIKQILNSIQDRLLKNMSNEEIFNTSKFEYKNALKKSGFKIDFEYTKNQQQKPKNRTRNIIWFNPPINKEVSTNVAKIFLQLINRHFPKPHRLHKIFNRNTVKVNYNCMQNMSKIYKGHNSKITSTRCNQLTLCNC